MKYAFVFMLSAALWACKKNELGGKSSISGHVVHHAARIPNATVFIKFNATEFPGSDTTLYDEKVRADDKGYYWFRVYQGTYYLYGRGVDRNAIDPAKREMRGGVPVRARNSENINADVAITEAH